MKQENEIPIFLAIDEKYAPYAGVAIQSMEGKASKDYKYVIYVLYQDIENKSKERIQKLENENFEIKFVPMKKGLEAITDRKENKLRCDYFTLTIYFRLFIADMFPEYDKGIYIDSDVVVPGDISELYNIDLKGNVIGAIHDFSIEGVPELKAYIENVIGVKLENYINSGVLLMDLKKLRDQNFASKFLELLNTYHFDCIAPDQDYINAMCSGKILYIDKSWDIMPDNRKPAYEKPNLIHYNLFEKPWCYDNIQYEDYFWNYAKKSEFYEDILNFKNSYSDEQKKSDAECMKTLVSKGGRIAETEENTFKKRYESGVKIRL